MNHAQGLKSQIKSSSRLQSRRVKKLTQERQRLADALSIKRAAAGKKAVSSPY